MAASVYTIQASLLPVSSWRVRTCGGVPTLTSIMYAPCWTSFWSACTMVPLGVFARRWIGLPLTACRRWKSMCTTPSGVALGVAAATPRWANRPSRPRRPSFGELRLFIVLVVLSVRCLAKNECGAWGTSSGRAEGLQTAQVPQDGGTYVSWCIFSRMSRAKVTRQEWLCGDPNGASVTADNQVRWGSSR